MRSFMSLVSILTALPNRVCGLGKLAHGNESRPDGDTLPIAVVLRFLFFHARDLANDSAGIEPHSLGSRLDTLRQMLA
jgi:hypothetical protein